MGSSKIGAAILSVVKGQASGFVIDLLFLLEGQADDELPEGLIGGARFEHVNLFKTTTQKDRTRFDFSKHAGVECGPPSPGDKNASPGAAGMPNP